MKRSADVSGSGRRFCLFEFNYAGCEQSRSEMERWTRTTQRTRNESCVRLGKRTPFLRFRVQLLGYEDERSGQNHWTDMSQGTAYSRADISGNGRQSCEPEFNYNP